MFTCRKCNWRRRAENEVSGNWDLYNDDVLYGRVAGAVHRNARDAVCTKNCVYVYGIIHLIRVRTYDNDNVKLHIVICCE